MEKTNKKNWIVSGLLVLAFVFGLFTFLGVKSPEQKVYATDTFVAGSELKIETIIGGTHSTTFAGGKYLHLDPIDKNHYTNSVSANADMEYDETTGVLKIFKTENTYNVFDRYISIIATNTTDKKLTIKAYGGIYLYVLDFPNGDLTITNGEGVHDASLYWNNKLVITGKLTICGDIECNAAPTTNPGLYSESTSWISADEMELLDSASLWVYSSYNTYTCGVNVRYLTLNTDGYLYINAKGNTNNSFTYVLYVAYQVNFTKCLYMSLYSPLDTVASITNSSYFKNAVDTAPIEGYDAVINRVKTGKYGDYGEDLYRREYELSRLLNVTYNSNGGTGTMNSEDVKYNGKLTLPACTFTAPVGKQFAGWAVGSADATPLRTPSMQIQITEPTVIYAVWEDVPREFTSVPSNATKQVGQSYTATWTVNFDAVEYAVCIWNGSAWQELYHYDANTTTAGTQMSYNITSDVAGEKRYKIDCFYDYWHYVTSDEFVITWEAAPVNALTGTVAINGNLKYGETLTAVLSGDNNTGTLSYEWRRNGETISGATNSTYTLTQDDIGYTMSVVVRSSVESGSLVGTAASIIDKADGPNAPTGITATACTTNANNNGTLVGITAEMEYKLSSSEDWTAGTGATITNLANGTYNVRYKATATHKAGASANVVVNAYNAPVQYGITVVDGGANVLSAEAGTTITITADEAPSGYVFDKWTSTDGVVFADENSATTTFNMPSKAVTITATYKLAEVEPEAKGGLSAGAVVAIVLSSLIVVSIGGFAVYWFVIKKKTWADFVALFKRK